MFYLMPQEEIAVIAQVTTLRYKYCYWLQKMEKEEDVEELHQ